MLSQIIVNEAIINQKVFEIYGLTDFDKSMVLAKEGESIGGLPVNPEAKKAYLENEILDFPLNNISEYIESLPEKEFEVSERETIEKRVSATLSKQ